MFTLENEAHVKVSQTQMTSLNMVWLGFTMRHGFGAEVLLSFYRERMLDVCIIMFNQCGF